MSTATAAIVDSLPKSGYSQKMTAAEEQQLLERIRAGDDSGFEQLVREHTGKVIGLAWRLLGSREEAEDLAQEAFLRLHRSLAGFRGDSRISTWAKEISDSGLLKIGSQTVRTADSSWSTRVPCGTQPESRCSFAIRW